MTDRVRVLREQAAEFRRLAARPGNSPGLKERLLQLSEQCNRIADGIERSLSAAARPN